MGKILPFRRRPRLPPIWAPYRSRRRYGPGGRIGRWTAAELRITLWAGLLLGLLLFHAMRLTGPGSPSLPWASAPAVEVFGGGGDVVERVSPGAVRVIDGDTFDYRGMRVRIADIDTAELRSQCAREAALAAAATRRLAQLLRAGPFELHPSGRDEDRYGRKLRIVTRDGRSIGDQLVAEGLARTWTGRREPWC